MMRSRWVSSQLLALGALALLLLLFSSQSLRPNHSLSHFAQVSQYLHARPEDFDLADIDVSRLSPQSLESNTGGPQSFPIEKPRIQLRAATIPDDIKQWAQQGGVLYDFLTRDDEVCERPAFRLDQIELHHGWESAMAMHIPSLYMWFSTAFGDLGIEDSNTGNWFSIDVHYRLKPEASMSVAVNPRSGVFVHLGCGDGFPVEGLPWEAPQSWADIAFAVWNWFCFGIKQSCANLNTIVFLRDQSSNLPYIFNEVHAKGIQAPAGVEDQRDFDHVYPGLTLTFFRQPNRQRSSETHMAALWSSKIGKAAQMLAEHKESFGLTAIDQIHIFRDDGAEQVPRVNGNAQFNRPSIVIRLKERNRNVRPGEGPERQWQNVFPAKRSLSDTDDSGSTQPTTDLARTDGGSGSVTGWGKRFEHRVGDIFPYDAAPADQTQVKREISKTDSSSFAEPATDSIIIKSESTSNATFNKIALNSRAEEEFQEIPPEMQDWFRWGVQLNINMKRYTQSFSIHDPKAPPPPPPPPPPPKRVNTQQELQNLGWERKEYPNDLVHNHGAKDINPLWHLEPFYTPVFDDLDVSASCPPNHLIAWEWQAPGGNPSKLAYVAYYNPADEVIWAMTSVAQGDQNRFPDVWTWNDIAISEYLGWWQHDVKPTATRAEKPGISKFIFPRIIDRQTLFVIKFILSFWGPQQSLPTFENKITLRLSSGSFKPGTRVHNQAYALLGTPYGEKVANFFIEHKDRLTRRHVVKIHIFKDDSCTSVNDCPSHLCRQFRKLYRWWNDCLPTLAFELEGGGNVKAGYFRDDAELDFYIPNYPDENFDRIIQAQKSGKGDDDPMVGASGTQAQGNNNDGDGDDTSMPDRPSSDPEPYQLAAEMAQDVENQMQQDFFPEGR